MVLFYPRVSPPPETPGACSDVGFFWQRDKSWQSSARRASVSASGG